MDEKNVLNGINCCLINGDPECHLCPYDAIDLRCRANLRNDLIDLLKAQEPIAPIENAGFYYCGACKYAFTVHRQKYCSECGRAVKWE